MLVSSPRVRPRSSGPKVCLSKRFVQGEKEKVVMNLYYPLLRNCSADRLQRHADEVYHVILPLGLAFRQSRL